MLLLGVTRLQCYLNETLGHAKRNYVRNLGVDVLGKVEGMRC